MSRVITVTLTEVQYDSLASAVALAEADWESMQSAYFDRRIKTLNSAWAKIAAAWHAKAYRAIKEPS